MRSTIKCVVHTGRVVMIEHVEKALEAPMDILDRAHLGHVRENRKFNDTPSYGT